MSYNIGSVFLELPDGNKLELKECRFNLEHQLQESIERSIEILEKVFGFELINCGKLTFPSAQYIQADLVLVCKEETDEGDDYIPMVIELKRERNKEDLRRKALAQLLEYMTAIYLESEYLTQQCKKYDNIDLERLKKNIEKRRIRGVILSEYLPDILKKTIEILNQELENMEIYGVELKRLCDNNEKYTVTVPILIGITTETERKSKTPVRILWTYDMLVKEYNTIENNVLRERLLDLLNWARNKGLLLEYKSNIPRFRISNGIISVNPDGILYFAIGKRWDKVLPKEKRLRLLKELKQLRLIKDNIDDPDIMKDGTGSERPISDLTDEEFERLKKILEEILPRVN